MGVGGLSAWISSWVRRRSMIGPRAMGGGVGGALVVVWESRQRCRSL